jgi:transposase
VNYQEISKKYNIKVSVLTRRVSLLKIKGIFKGRKIYFSDGQINQMLEYDTRHHFKIRDNSNHPRKLAFIEFYLKFKSGRRVATFLNTSRKLVDAAIKEYNETGFITVESKLNKNELM